MADEFPEREDPALVRPYISTEPCGGSAGADRRAETWPEPAAVPEDHTREMAPVPAPAPEPDPAARNSALLRQRLIVLAGIGGLALLAVVAFVMVGSPDGDDPPPNVRPSLAAPSVTGALGAAPAASTKARSTPPSSSRSPAADTNPARNATPSTRNAVGQATNAPPSATLAPPPDPARTGAITAASGRCLTLGGLFALDGSPVQTASCTGGRSQRWTRASDGTLVVADKCAHVSADGTVRIGACDESPAAQWRAGPNGSLVNPETGRCLTEPGTVGAATQVTACTGAADQRWKLS